MKHILLAASILLLAVPASAQVIVVGPGKAQTCFQFAKTGNTGTKNALKSCDEALDDKLMKRDVAATHVNRGVLLMRKGETDRAVADYKVAIDMYPDLAEAHINHGVALFHDGRFDAAVKAYSTALSLDTDKQAAALFNRALAYERMEDYRAAYFDLKSALEIKPDWDLAEEALTRFTVTRKTS
ncbi:tetratricopeptide repeat protein [Algimonas porphyrae]|uniref:Tetratricopeptide repeat protein n=1 Tax=Algimonas porphyrae TaxID=1128113 RepID=A0ABQ5V5B3_9PROT|nr:tetratricopeptide repeat protein [Algimonas porphyrae]GLQ21860.1 hypothetical protein GCM10007854_28150 [Algimonas porphyrae]